MKYECVLVKRICGAGSGKSLLAYICSGGKWMSSFLVKDDEV